MNFYKIKYSNSAEKFIKKNKTIGIRFLKAFEEIKTNRENIRFYDMTNCQIKCNTYGKKPKSSSLGVLYCIHFLGLLFIKLKLSFKSLIFTSDKSIPLG